VDWILFLDFMMRFLFPDFLYAALDATACAAFIKESRMNLATRHQAPQEIRVCHFWR
jgi:hypothetical protein